MKISAKINCTCKVTTLVTWVWFSIDFTKINANHSNFEIHEIYVHPSKSVFFTDMYMRLMCALYYSGMLSKSKGQILRVSACLHALFYIETPSVIPEVISVQAIRAAIDLVEVCIQHAAFLAGREDVNDMIEDMRKGNWIPVVIWVKEGLDSHIFCNCTYLVVLHIWVTVDKKLLV